MDPRDKKPMFNKEIKKRTNRDIVNDAGRLSTERRAMQTNFALFNFMLNKVDFRKCFNMMEATRKMYVALYPTIHNLVEDKRELIALLLKSNLKEDPALKAILERGIDPQEEAAKVLEEMKEAARARSQLAKKGIDIDGVAERGGRNKIKIIT